MASPVVRHVVVDAGGFIRNAPIRDIGENVYTIPEVISESCDKATRKRLQVLPYTIHFKQPSAEAVVFVSDFAKKTGDYCHLSATDIQVLALTYMLEKEHVGVEHIKKHPDVKPPTYIVPNKATERTDIAGFYMGRQKSGSTKDEKNKEVPKHNLKSGDETEEKNEERPEIEIIGRTETKDKVKTAEGGSDEMENLNVEQSRNCEMDIEQVEVGTDLELIHEANDEDDILPDDLLVEMEDSEGEEEGGEEEDDDDDEGWITPSNIKSVMRQMGGGYEETEEKQVAVACLTTDFAMQNVLIHMGLNVVSVDGMLIKRASSYVLRCTACFKITYQMEKVFCSHCGNKTLKRVAMTREEDGTIRYFFSKRPLSLKGKKFPLPMPKGGKHSNNPVLFEDQPTPQQRMPRKAQEKVDIFSPDFVAGSSPFALNDVTSRAAKIGISGKHDFRRGAYWNKRNPNEPHKYYGKKKSK